MLAPQRSAILWIVIHIVHNFSHSSYMDRPEYWKWEFWRWRAEMPGLAKEQGNDTDNNKTDLSITIVSYPYCVEKTMYGLDVDNRTVLFILSGIVFFSFIITDRLTDEVDYLPIDGTTIIFGKFL